MSLRIVSWNIHGCVGTDGEFNPLRIARALLELEPDLALLQEVGDHRGIHPPIDQATTLAGVLGFTCAVGVTLPHPRESFGYGNATLTRHPLASSTTFDLSVAGREPRVCLRAAVLIGRVELVTLNVHLGLGPGERRRQLSFLIDETGPIGDDEAPLVLAGDFNDFPPGPVTRTLAGRLLDVGAQGGKTFPSRRPLLRLDRVYLSKAIRPLQSRVVRTRAARVASDHLAMVVDVELAAG